MAGCVALSPDRIRCTSEARETHTCTWKRESCADHAIVLIHVPIQGACRFVDRSSILGWTNTGLQDFTVQYILQRHLPGLYVRMRGVSKDFDSSGRKVSCIHVGRLAKPSADTQLFV